MASAFAIPANAETPDSQFLDMARGIGNPSLATLGDAAPDVVTKAGRSVCTMLDDGYGTQAVTGMVLDRLALNGEQTDYDAMIFGIYAVSVYCPAHQADSAFNDNF
jgi:hypothetical protein